MEAKYNAMKVEEGKYNKWLQANYFTAGNKGKDPYCIVIPPPNVTGKLHLGHAWDTAIQDIIIRFKRMQGFDALWLPGMDHAGIATQAKIDAKLKSEGLNPREMDREEWLKIAWNWKKEYASSIKEQWAKLGLSLDYTRERFTLDDKLNKAVNKVFVDLYHEGLIYQGEKIINWDPEAKTALSNEEVEYKDVKGAFYHIKYFVEGTKDYLEIATTRPETLFGDTAVAVNPLDERYQKYLGKKVILPIVNRLIPIIADEHADPEFGTGVVKITPAHDPNDFLVGERHGLPRIVCINPDGTMNEQAFNYVGMDRFICREELVRDLEKQDLLIKVQEIIHSVGHSQRSGVMIEPYLSKQWFIKMRPLADCVLLNQKNPATKVNFIPNHFEKTMNHWMEITYDWCISRQLWWGHRIPAWYKDDQIYVGEEAPKENGWVQDKDVLDTWFSSALWPFSTLGWPEKTDDYDRYYPNNVLVTGYDIIPFWVNRMTFQGLKFTDHRPFKDCLIHGLVRDKEGRKMSKSLGNGIDPIEIINEYGADALRLFLTTSVASGMDLRFDLEKVKASWNFINKLWNASRFVLLNLEDYQPTDYSLKNLSHIDKWILTKLNKTIKEVTSNMESYDFNLVGNTLIGFVWNDFCDNYIELSKFNNNKTTQTVLLIVLTNILKMLHPFIPFVTDELYEALSIKDENICISQYPLYDEKNVYLTEMKQVDKMLEFITYYRNKIVELNIPKTYEVVTNVEGNIIQILKLRDKVVVNPHYNEHLSISLNNYTIDVYYDNTANIASEKANLEQEQQLLIVSIKRREQLLSNEGYLKKAPQEIVNNEMNTLTKEKEQLLKVSTALKKY